MYRALVCNCNGPDVNNQMPFRSRKQQSVMEEEPAERVTVHHRSVGKEGPQRRGWMEG